MTWTFDALARVIMEQNELGAFTYTYDGPTGRVASVAYPNGQLSTYSYYPNTQDHRLQTILHQYPNGATLSKFDYTYDKVGNIQTWRQQADTTAVVWEYGYDAADQLTAAVKKATDPQQTVLQRFAYAYDPSGNRTLEQIDDQATGWTYNTVNELVTQSATGAMVFEGTVDEPATVTVAGQPASVSPTNVFRRTAPVTAGTTTVAVTATDASGNTTSKQYQVSNSATAKTFAYDANGNLIGDGSRTFEWDAQDRLVAVNKPGERVEFAYDGRDRRVAITRQGATTSLTWCGRTICSERRADGSLNHIYSGAETRAGDINFVLRDHLGSGIAVTDPSATVQERTEFDPYGRVLARVGASSVSVGYAGYYRTSATDLNLTFARAYDAGVGRWISQDPLKFVDGTNTYGYVLQNPLRYIDPDGLFCVSATWFVTPWLTYRREISPITGWSYSFSAYFGEELGGSVGCVWRRVVSVGDYQSRYVLKRFSCYDGCPPRVYGYFQWNRETRELGYTRFDQEIRRYTDVGQPISDIKCMIWGPPS